MEAHELLARAFQDDPFVCWAEPDARRRPRTMSRVFSGVLRYARSCGGQLYEPGLGAVSWRGPKRAQMGPLSLLTSGAASVVLVAPPPVWVRLASHEDVAMRRVERWLDDDTAYLCSLGVNPDCSGQGHGSRLLQAALERIERSWSRCVLRTEQPKNLELYRRNGFDLIDELVVAASGLPVWIFARGRRAR